MAEPQKKEQTEKWRSAPIADEGVIASEGEKWRQAPLSEPSLGAKAKAFTQSVLGSATESGGVVAGAVAGGAFGAPGGPLGIALGASLGAGAGYLAGRELRSSPRPEEQPEELRPYAYGGEVVGGSLPFALAPVGIAQTGARTGGRFIDGILDMAQRSPKTFLASEAAATAGAAIGSAVSETYLPGRTGPRIASEIAGGFFNPSRLVIGASHTAASAFRRAVSSYMPTSAGQALRENEAAKVLQKIVREAGEDPVALAKALRESGVVRADVTAAQKTGSPALIALETKLTAESARFGADAQKAATDGIAAVNDMITALRGTGDPQLLRAAADIEAKHFRSLIAARIQNAEREAVTIASQITKDTPAARAELSKRASELVDEALRDARAAERELWDKVPKDGAANGLSIIERHGAYRNELLPEEKMPAVLDGFMDRIKKTVDVFNASGKTNTGELIQFRSRMLALARESAGKGDLNDARIYGGMAEAALEDINRASQGNTAYDAARSFSKELNDTFTRTFVGDAQAVTARGADRIPPELLMRKALGVGEEAGALRFKQLTDAMTMLKDRGIKASTENFDAMLDIQARVLRLSAAEAIDPLTGRANPQRLAKFVRDNEELLKNFPEVRSGLDSAVRSEVKLRDLEQFLANASATVEKKAAFAKLAKFENPVDAVGKAISGKEPVADLTAIAKLARRGGVDAVDGFKASVVDNALSKATSANGVISFDKLRRQLFEPIAPKQPSVMQVLRENGAVSQGEYLIAERMFKEAKRIEEAVKGGQRLERLLESPDAFTDLVIRVMGARLGSAMSVGGGSGSSLIAAGRGSQFARQVFDRVPQARVRDVLIEAAKNPRFAALLLERPTTDAAGIRIARQIHAYLINAGISATEE